jgi:hypothetical protein
MTSHLHSINGPLAVVIAVGLFCNEGEGFLNRRRRS